MLKSLTQFFTKPSRSARHSCNVVALLVENALISDLAIEYEIFEAKRDEFVWGFLDFSEMRPGDRFELRLYSPIMGKEYLFEHWAVEGQQEAPGFTLSERLLLKGSRITVTQVRGISKRLTFAFYRRGG